MAMPSAPAGRHHGTERWLTGSMRDALSGRGGPLGQVLVLGVPLLLYLAARSLVADQQSAAMDNAARILKLEYRLGLDWESTFQGQAVEYGWLITLCNWIYMFGHFPLLLGALGALWWIDRSEFLGLRNSLIVSGSIGLVFFALYPVAPPRLFAPGLFVDTLVEQSRSYHVLQNPKVTNQYAAVPSLHVGWNLLVALALVRVLRSRLVRVLAWMMVLAMSTAVVLTANHWLIDIAAGVAVALAGFMVARLVHHLFDKSTPMVTPLDQVIDPPPTPPAAQPPPLVDHE